MDSGEKDNKASVNHGRRRIGKAALASPILASLATRPVWGTSCSISGMNSGNASVTGKDECEGSGCTPGFWKNNPQAWLVNTPYDPGSCRSFSKGGSCKEWNGGTGTKFNAVFGAGPSDCMMDILLRAAKDDRAYKTGNFLTQLAHCIAALLNAAASPTTYGATAEQVINAVGGALNNALFDDAGNKLTMNQLFDVLVRMNEAGGEAHCIYNAHGFCGETDVSNGTECIPACEGGQAFDYCKQQCVDESQVTVSLEDVLSGKKSQSDCPTY